MPPVLELVTIKWATKRKRKPRSLNEFRKFLAKLEEPFPAFRWSRSALACVSANAWASSGRMWRRPHHWSFTMARGLLSEEEGQQA
jgi:hypothetical protein